VNARVEESPSGVDFHHSIGWRPQVAAGICLLLYLACFVFLFTTQRPAFREADFASFYLAGRILLERPPAELFDLEAQRAFQQQTDEFSFKPYIHPPFEAFLFLPFSLLRYEVALWIWFGLNFLSVAVLPWVLPWVLPRLYSASATRHPLILSVCIISFYPIYLCLLNGQDSILFLWVLLLFFSSWRLGKYGLAGSLLGLTFIKPHLAVLLALPFLIQRKTRGLLCLALCGCTLWLVSAAWLGTGWTFAYVDLLKEAGTHDSLEATAPSARAHLRQRPATMHNWIGQLSALGLDQIHGFGGAGVLGLLVLLLQVMIWKSKGTQSDPWFALRFASNTLLALLASFHLYMYDLAIGFLPLLVCFEYAFNQRGPLVRVLQVLVGISPLVWMHPAIHVGGLDIKTTVIWMSGLLVATLVVLCAQRASPFSRVSSPRGKE
jgi:hypothetical protein